MATTNFALDILKCPPDVSIKSIVYTAPTKMCVVQGGETLMCIDLKDFFIPVTDAMRTTFTLAANSVADLPLDQYLFDYCGLGATTSAKFASFFFDYGATATSSQEYVEWAFSKDLDAPLATMDPVLINNSGSTAGATSSDTSYQINLAYAISKIDGTLFGFSSQEAVAVVTRGGLKFWSENDGVVLLNTFNSEIPTNNLSCATYSADGVLWVGTQEEGIFSVAWNDSKYSFAHFTASSSSLISDQINDIYVSNGILYIATESGISTYDIENSIWESYSNSNVNEINESSFNAIYYDSGYILAGSTGGVYVYDIAENSWSKYNSSINGWDLSDSVNRIISSSQEVYVGLEDGLLTFTIGATVCQEIDLPFGATSSYNEVSDLFYTVGASGQDSLIVSSLSGAISSYNILGSTWSFSYVAPGGTSANLMSDGISKIAVSDYVYFANIEGFGKFNTTLQTVSTLPLSSQTSDILFSYPLDGEFPVSSSQKIYVGFSKQVNQTVLGNHIVFNEQVSSTPVTYSLTSTDGYLYTITPSANFDYAKLYNFEIEQGLTSTDGKYFKQVVQMLFASYDKNPIHGWNIAGKQLLLSGAEGKLIDSIIFRNPQPYDVSVTALIAV